MFRVIVAVYHKKDMKQVITLGGKMQSQFGVKTNGTLQSSTA
jgi:hypothetical protein